MNKEQLIILLEDLVKQPNESEWVEFKHNFHSPQEIGERISALSNGACIHGQNYGYLVFGIEDKTHKIIGTSFKAKSHKKGNEELEHWLAQRLDPRIDFEVVEFDYDKQRHISLYIIPATRERPVLFMKQAYIRIGSITRKLEAFPDKEAKIWRKRKISFEKDIAKDGLSTADIVGLLSTETYFDLMQIPFPQDQNGIINRFITEKFVQKTKSGLAITNLGAILFAKDLNNFEQLVRKSVRVIKYQGKNKVTTEREQIGIKGYALGFFGLVNWVNGQLPANEEIGKVLREDSRMYPEIAIRELIANALIHQDFSVKGFPMVEIFSDRIEISNPGDPLITPDRFIDSYISRNEIFADVMRRMRFCEEKGSGLDKVIFYNELYQLPPIQVKVQEHRTTVSLYSYRGLKNLEKREKIRACYQHACLKYVSNEKMSNESLRDRFKIEPKNAAIASRIIRETFESGLIKDDDPESNSRKHRSYVPFWA